MMILPLLLAALIHSTFAVQGAKYIGCYKDQGSRALVGQWTHGAEIDNDECVQRCSRQGFKYAATQYTSHCFCGDSYNKYGPATNCNMKCAADHTQICGGGWANSVYEIISPQLDRVGCYKDAALRAIVGYWFDSKQMTNQRCVAICGKMGFAFAATQYSSHCFCGNAYDRYGINTVCNMACSGDKKQICGGPWANTVFRTGSSTTAVPEATRKGCFKDAGVRAMTGLWSHSASMTNERCQQTCLAEDKKFAATQYSSHCFCGDSFDRYGVATNCNMKCSGKHSDTCGGGWANEVFEIKPATKKPETCPKQREQFKENGIDVEPEFTADCKFLVKQCNSKKCWCVKAGSGKIDFKGVEIPVGEKFNCKRKPKRCEKKRFSILLKGKEGAPECAESGQFAPKQCNKVECWCVNKKSGKEKRKTRTSNGASLKC